MQKNSTVEILKFKTDLLAALKCVNKYNKCVLCFLEKFAIYTKIDFCFKILNIYANKPILSKFVKYQHPKKLMQLGKIKLSKFPSFFTYGARAATCDESCWPLVCGSVWPPARQQIAKSRSTECRIMVHAHSHKFTCCCSPCTRRGPFDLREELERRAHSLLLPETLAAHLYARSP